MFGTVPNLQLCFHTKQMCLFFLTKHTHRTVPYSFCGCILKRSPSSLAREREKEREMFISLEGEDNRESERGERGERQAHYPLKALNPLKDSAS